MQKIHEKTHPRSHGPLTSHLVTVYCSSLAATCFPHSWEQYSSASHYHDNGCRPARGRCLAPLIKEIALTWCSSRALSLLLSPPLVSFSTDFDEISSSGESSGVAQPLTWTLRGKLSTVTAWGGRLRCRIVLQCSYSHDGCEGEWFRAMRGLRLLTSWYHLWSVLNFLLLNNRLKSAIIFRFSHLPTSCPETTDETFFIHCTPHYYSFFLFFFLFSGGRREEHMLLLHPWEAFTFQAKYLLTHL